MGSEESSAARSSDQPKYDLYFGLDYWGLLSHFTLTGSMF
jgi:hypothetical protein